MTVTLWIAPALQFGALAPGEARQGSVREALAQAIKRHLFEDPQPGPGAVGGYERVLIAFARTLSQGLQAPSSRPAARSPRSGPKRRQKGLQAPSSRPAARSLWARLFSDEVLASAAAAAVADQVPVEVETAFCFSVQGLCSALALRWVESPVDADEDSSEKEADEETDNAGTADGKMWRAEYPQVLGAISALLRRAVWRWLRDEDADKTSKAEDLRLVSAMLLDALLAALDDWFAVVTGETQTRGGRPYTPKYILLRRPELAVSIDRLIRELPFQFTVQPLKEPLAYRPDDQGPADERGDYFRVDLIGYRRSNAFLRRLHAGASNVHHRAPEFLRYVEAVNLQQAVPWRINRELLRWAWSLVAVGGGEAGGGTDPQSEISLLEAEALTELREWVRKHFYQPVDRGSRRSMERPGEFLDSPLAYRAIEDLCRDGPTGEPLAFYLPWKADYRGRIYAETPWLTPQGGDLQRALFELHRGRPLNDLGVRALRRHGANLVQRERLVKDLAIEGRQVVTLMERESWVVDHEAEILASAESPLTQPFWRTVAGKPMQFLAFCLAYRQWKLAPAQPVHVPVQIDGTCNGLQHIAALTADAKLARAVNVLSREDGLPGDIYSELAEVAGDTLGHLPFGAGEAVHQQGLDFAERWLVASPQRQSWLNRDTAKKVVMTIPYGASWGAQARYVIEKIAGAFEQQWQDGAPPLGDLDDLVAWKEQEKDRRIFVARCTWGLFKDLRRSAFADSDELSTRLAHRDWEHKRTLAAYVGLALVRHLHAALDSRYPAVNAFSNWLKETAGACAGLPLVWLSPLGFPVCQNKFQLRGTSVTGRLGSRKVRIDVQRLDEAVDPRRQRDALLPNLIHSLDATHLAMTLLKAKERGVADVGSIHDCLLCHPNDAAALGNVVRSTFAGLYAPGRLNLPDPLIRWRDWMALLVELKLAPRRAEILAALTYPGQGAECDLDHDARRADQDAVRADAVRALDVLSKIRRRDAPERFLLRVLLDRAVSLPTPKRPPPMPSLPCTGGLPWGRDVISDYFFS